MRRSLGLVAIALGVASCGGGAETTTSAPIAPTTSAFATSQPATSTTTVATTTAAPTTTTAAPTIGAQLLVAAPDGVFLVGADGGVELLIEGPAAFAIDDLDGGVIFQQERWSRERRSLVYRVRSGGGELVELLVPAFDQGLVLDGIAVDGDTYVYYTRTEGTTPEDTKHSLRRYSLQTKEVTELETIGGWESGAYPISVSERLLLLNWFAEAAHGFDFYDLAGNQVAVAADPDLPEGAFFDCGTCPARGELSTDGSQLVYVERVGGTQYVVIKHVASGAEVRRIELAEGGWAVDSLDLTVDHLVVNRNDNDGPIAALVYDLGQVAPEPVELPVAGEAYVTRSPVSIESVVAAP